MGLCELCVYINVCMLDGFAWRLCLLEDSECKDPLNDATLVFILPKGVFLGLASYQVSIHPHDLRAFSITTCPKSSLKTAQSVDAIICLLGRWGTRPLATYL